MRNAVSRVALFVGLLVGEAVAATGGREMEERALGLADEQDVYAAVEYLAEQADVVEAVKVLNRLMRKMYWEEKDIGRCVAFGRAGVQLGLTEGRRAAASDAERSEQLLGQAKAVSYNLASFTWPGWDEDGIELSRADVVMGLDAAKVNLRLAIELERGPDPMGKAHWLLGAHFLSARNLDRAREHFELARDFEKQANPENGGSLQDGYLAVTGLVANPGDPALEQKLREAQEGLRKLEDGDFLADQLTTALAVFQKAD